MKLIPLFYFTRTGMVCVIWAQNVSVINYDSAWFDQSLDPIVSQVDVDIAEKIEYFPTLEDAYDAVAKYYQGLK